MGWKFKNIDNDISLIYKAPPLQLIFKYIYFIVGMVSLFKYIGMCQSNERKAAFHCC